MDALPLVYGGYARGHMTGVHFWAFMHYFNDAHGRPAPLWDWDSLPKDWQLMVDYAVTQILDPRAVPNVTPTPALDSLAMLRKYGRHLPHCPACGPCDCGFDAIVQQLPR